jgi:hypothetical protein
VRDAPRALLLVGSPRRKRSTSLVLGSRVLERLAGRGWQTGTRHLLTELERDSTLDEVVRDFWAADLVILAFPVYVDSLPAHMVRALEQIAARRPRHSCAGPGSPAVASRPRLVGVANSGFPERVHTRLPLDLCARFCREAGVVWAGGLGLGAGPVIDGRPLESRGFLVRRVVRALDLAAAALAEGGEVPPEAAGLMARPPLPAWLFRKVAGRNMAAAAKKGGVGDRLGHRPYPWAE